MYFRTQSNWLMDDPIYKVFDDPDNPSFRWCAVEFPLSVFYYHVRIVPKSDESDGIATDILICDIQGFIDILKYYPDSTLALQAPAWLNDGELGLYRVDAIYKSLETGKQLIAECSNGKMYVLEIGGNSDNINLMTLKKEPIWQQLKTDRK